MFDIFGGDIAKRSAAVIRAGGTLVTIAGPTEARPADGLTIDFVVVSYRVQLSEIIRRVRDGRLRTNIGNVSNSRRCRRRLQSDRGGQGQADHGEDDHPRSSVGIRADRCSRSALSGSVGCILSAPSRATWKTTRGFRTRCRTRFSLLEHIRQRDK